MKQDAVGNVGKQTNTPCTPIQSPHYDEKVHFNTEVSISQLQLHHLQTQHQQLNER